MNEFVDQCLREWARLGVPGQDADEMATDLATDLREAESDGVSPEELIGSEILDAPSFAQSWARERGLIPAYPHKRIRWRGLLIAAVVLGTAGAVAAVLVRSPESRPPAIGGAAPRSADRNEVVVPDLQGLSRGEATGQASAAGLRFIVRYRDQERFSTLDVVAQSPRAGSMVRRGSTLFLVVRR